MNTNAEPSPVSKHLTRNEAKVTGKKPLEQVNWSKTPGKKSKNADVSAGRYSIKDPTSIKLMNKG